jgi:hypothetical protein
MSAENQPGELDIGPPTDPRHLNISDRISQGSAHESGRNDRFVTDPEPHFLEKNRESVRSHLATWIMWFLFIYALLSIAVIVWDRSLIETVKEITQLTAVPLTTIFSTVIGFYFGQQSAR